MAAWIATPRMPSQKLPVAIWTMAPVKAMCQMFQMSTLRTRVVLVSSMTTFTAMATGMATRPRFEAHAMGEVPGQPRSTTVRPRFQLSAMAWAAGPMELVSKSTTSEMPTKPTPMVSAERSDLATD